MGGTYSESAAATSGVGPTTVTPTTIFGNQYASPSGAVSSAIGGLSPLLITVIVLGLGWFYFVKAKGRI
jgi:hypothetical protein